MSLGKKLLILRESKGLTQDALAKLTGWSEERPNIGVSQGAISALEKRDSKSSKHATTLARALGVPLDALLGDVLPHKVTENISSYNVSDPVLTDLNELDQEDADVWRAQIRAAAIKARKAKQEKSDRDTPSGIVDPPSEGRRTA